MTKIRFMTLIVIFMVGGVILTGCWDSIELNRRSIIAGLGIDLDPQDDRRVLASLQVIIPSEISGKYSRGSAPVVLFTGKGENLDEAIREVSRKVPRIPSLAHIRTIVISEELARKGIRDLMDYLDRDPEIRMNSRVFIAHEQRAEEVMGLLTAVGKIPANDLFEKSDTTSLLYGTNYRIEIDDLIRALQRKGGGPLINGVKVTGKIEEAPLKSNTETSRPEAFVELTNLALFKEDKLVNWLDRDESKGAVWLADKMSRTVVVGSCEGEYGKLSLSVEKSKTKIKMMNSDPEHPHFKVQVRLQAVVNEADCRIDLRTSKSLPPLERMLSKQVEGFMKRAVQVAQLSRSDAFGFGETFNRAHPSAWKKVKDHWEDVFPTIRVEYEVKALIKNLGMRDRSIQWRMEQGGGA
ncbi:Ger(x)C family spore germination protein [Paenibacillus sp. CAA11]|uniref:Ger(x)C family spore germination protein n=1 Tax=Paenibacillus sp. CAA11 TaxID=1532905 RepID=UPI000D33C825|nr:Ger(x)C family spore germination protein [Paenibacillus sp. CAA11]AWB46329.1 Ger(x)C family spore germination protein [Paenibacillus sp. CAA11]